MRKVEKMIKEMIHERTLSVDLISKKLRGGWVHKADLQEVLANLNRIEVELKLLERIQKQLGRL